MSLEHNYGGFGSTDAELAESDSRNEYLGSLSEPVGLILALRGDPELLEAVCELMSYAVDEFTTDRNKNLLRICDAILRQAEHKANEIATPRDAWGDAA